MSSLSAFYAQNAVMDSTEKVIVSSRFKDETGKPIPWEVRSITEKENEEIRKSSTHRVKEKGKAATVEINQDEYMAKLVTSSVAFPNLKDAELQKSYKVMGAENLLKVMLLPGEYGTLLQTVQRVNGFDKEMEELVDEVKN